MKKMKKMRKMKKIDEEGEEDEAKDLRFIMVERNFILHPVKRQIFEDASRQTFYMT